jgi:tetratricopeptide (TPR) repeat protein
LRDAAYALLTEDDRALGHALAAEWLESVGAADALVIAEHWERGRTPSRAVAAFVRAAQQSLDGNDLESAIARAQRAIDAGATGDALGEAHMAQVEACKWLGNNAECDRHAEIAVTLFADRSPRRHRAVAEAVLAAGKLGRFDRVLAFARELVTEGEAAIDEAQASAVAIAASFLFAAGRQDTARELVDWLDAHGGAAAMRDPGVAARIEQTYAQRAQYAGDAASAVLHFEACLRAFEEIGDLRRTTMTRANVGYAYIELGEYERAKTMLRAALESAERMGLARIAAGVRHNLGLLVARDGAIDEGRAMEDAAAKVFASQGDRRLEGFALSHRALIDVIAGDARAGVDGARRAVEMLRDHPPARTYALSVLAHALRAAGSTDEAVDASREAMDVLTSLTGLEEGESFVRLEWAESLAAAGRTEDARRAIVAARDRVMERASKIADAQWRKRFLENALENARTLNLAAALDRPSP